MSEILKIDVNDYSLQSMKASGGVQPTYESKDVTITQNGTTTITADTGYDALSDVDVTVSGILDTSDATAAASDIASGKTAYVNGVLVTGNVAEIKNKGVIVYATATEENNHISASEETLVNVLYREHTEIESQIPKSSIATAINLQASNIKKDVTYLGVTGTYAPSPEILDSKAVKFYDYDGTLVDGYTKEEFLALTSLPTNPTHVGLTAQGWNWTLADAKTYVTNYDELNIGQTYVTDDNKTRLYIDLTEGRLEPVLGFAINGTATVSWGDNTTSTVTGSSTSTIVYTQHTYSTPGIYTITIDSNDDIYIIGDASNYSTILSSIAATNNDNVPYRNSLIKVELGNNVILGNAAFAWCNFMENIILPNSITSLGDYCFSNCASIKSIILPNNINNISAACFHTCTTLNNIVFSNSITEIKANAFVYCNALENITLPSACTILRYRCFSSCINLKRIKLLSNLVNLESGVFYGCKALEEAKLYPTVYRCTFASEVFSYCSGLKKVELGQGFGALDTSNFAYCSFLRDVSLPEGITTIPSTCFQSDSSLTYIKFPSTITSIKSYSFRYCYGMGVYDFTDLTSVPALNNSNAFDGIPTDCLIVVPDDLYEEWLEASGWVNLASHIIDERNWHLQLNP